MTISKRTKGRQSSDPKNILVRDNARRKNVPLWRVAEAYGKSEARFSVMLRHELPDVVQSELCDLIDQIAKERGNDNV